MERHTYSPEETQAFGRELGALLPPNTLILLRGDLGAGKTTFAKGLVAGAANLSENDISSPTFVYLNVYEGELPVYHFDLYRLHDADEFLGMGFDEFFEAGGICLVEWPERIEGILPETACTVEISAPQENERLFRIRGLSF